MSVLFVKQQSSVSEPPFRGIRGNVCDSSLARWRACSQLPIGFNQIFFTNENTSQSVFVKGGESL